MFDYQIIAQQNSPEGDKNDIAIDQDGNVVLLTGEVRLKQDIIKALLTTRGNHILMQGFGTALPIIIGQRMDGTTQTQIVNEIIYAVKYLSSIFPPTLLFMTDAEIIKQIQNIELVQDENDPRAYYVRLTLLLGTGNEMKLVIGG